MAADRGHGPAQTNLGAKYATGDGIPKDLVEAHICFNLASVKGNATAQRNMVMIERDMTPDQRAKAMELARNRFAAGTKPEATATTAKPTAAEPATLTATPAPSAAPTPDPAPAPGAAPARPTAAK
jgi:TPR repeat protein